MKLLTKKTDYAVRTLAVLSKNEGQFLSARHIARLQKLPYSFLKQILHTLIQGGLVVSKEGGKGGFKINKAANTILIADIIKLFQGKIMLSECMFRKQLCHNRSSCILRKEINRISQLVENEFTNISIAKLIRK